MKDEKCELIQTKNMYTLTVHMCNDRIYSNRCHMEKIKLFLVDSPLLSHPSSAMVQKVSSITSWLERTQQCTSLGTYNLHCVCSPEHIERNNRWLLITHSSPRSVLSSSENRSYPSTNSLQNHEWCEEHFLTK